MRWAALDAAVLAASMWLAYLFRFDFSIPTSTFRAALAITPFVLATQLFAARWAGVYRLVGKYVSLDDMGVFGRAATAWLLPMLIARFFLPAGPFRIPLSVALMDTLLGVAGLVALRLIQRLRDRNARDQAKEAPAEAVLLVGAGHVGVRAARDIRWHGRGLRVVGFVDDDPMKLGSIVAGVEVLGTTADIPELITAHDVDQVIVTFVDPGPGFLSRIYELGTRMDVRVRTVPSFIDVVQGSVAITRFHDVGVEDLLGRDPISLDPAELEGYAEDRTVMVTGAGGSIGSELARQAAALRPSKLLLVERFEGALFDIERSLRADHPTLEIIPFVADITDESRMRSVFRVHRPDVVVHAAAHKHVGMMERNPGEAVKNNTLGTSIVALLAAEFSAESFVLVSTDKAVRPTSIMGATKRLAEMVVQDLGEKYHETRFIAVRFGNVLASSGSVIPIFKDQVRRGGPVTVTHTEATRYFMTIPEASRLVLTAGAIGSGGEIMVLDMGQPVRILDLARNLITLSGYRPDHDIPISITGLGPGEKISEDLYATEEEMELTRHPKIFVGRAAPGGDMDSVLATLRLLIDQDEDQLIRQVIDRSIPDSQLMSETVGAHTFLPSTNGSRTA
jgi:FlaA1/EpsC-like NDP-sugar epimerase